MTYLSHIFLRHSLYVSTIVSKNFCTWAWHSYIVFVFSVSLFVTSIDSDGPSLATGEFLLVFGVNFETSGLVFHRDRKRVTLKLKRKHLRKKEYCTLFFNGYLNIITLTKEFCDQPLRLVWLIVQETELEKDIEDRCKNLNGFKSLTSDYRS